MMNSSPQFELKVRRIEHHCGFSLAGGGKSLVADVPYPDRLTQAYDYWKSAYVDYYRQTRVQLVKGGNIAPQGTRADLVFAEDQLRTQFQTWLLSPELHDLKTEIILATNTLSTAGQEWVDVFITCMSKELARLPWEIWQMGMDPAVASKIRIVRRPVNIRQTAVHPLRRQARVLVILGQDPKLDLKQDWSALAELPKTVKVTCYQSSPETSIAEKLDQILQHLKDPRGWDMLFFSGHSDETAAGGQLTLSPGISIQMSELKEALGVAHQHGLQFALFTSCNGLDIANTLIEAGIGQVVVMREPIPDVAAPVFLKSFLQQLALHQDVHRALQLTCDYLRCESLRLTYPSVSLVPSLFRHPQSPIFRIKPYGIWQYLQRWWPTRPERHWVARQMIVG